MSSKLVGFYRTEDQAQRARDDLIKAGFGHTDVHLYSGREEPGLWESIKEAFGFSDEEDRNLYHEAARRGAVALLVDLSDEDTPGEQRATQILQRHNPIDLDREAEAWRAQGWSGYRAATGGTAAVNTPAANTRAAAATTRPATTQHAHTTAPTTPPRAPAPPPQAARHDVETAPVHRAEQTEAIPVVHEELAIGKRAINRGGVRIYTRVIQKPVEEQVKLREEHVKVERRPVDRPATDADRAFQERTIEARETVEEPVVSKRARVVEEVHLGKEATERTETVRDSVRQTEVRVEPADKSAAGAARQTPGQFVPDEFVADLARDERYRGRDWNSVEPEFRRSFEQRYPGGKWDQFKDAVRRGYDRVRSKV